MILNGKHREYYTCWINALRKHIKFCSDCSHDYTAFGIPFIDNDGKEDTGITVAP